MALAECPECSGRVSSRAAACPHCGYPVRENAANAHETTDEEQLLAVSPRLFGGNWFIHFLVIILSLVVVGLILYLIEWLSQRATRLIITTRRTTLQRGLFDRTTSEIFHVDVRNVRVTQTFSDRMFGVGTLELSSSGQSDVEIAVKGMPDPQKIADLIRAQRA